MTQPSNRTREDSRATTEWRRRRALTDDAQQGARFIDALAAAARACSPTDLDGTAVQFSRMALAVQTLVEYAARETWGPVGERCTTTAERRAYGATHIRYYDAERPTP